MTTDRKKAIAYCRVSTKNQSEAGTSLDSQAEACQKKASELGYDIVRTTQEIYTGADLFERPLLNIDRADIRAGRIDALIIYTIDRLSRNVAHLAILDEECRKAKCELIFVQEDLDNSPEGRLLLSVRGYVAEVERLKIRERSMRGRRSKLLNGVPVFAKALYGYKADKDNLRYEIVEDEAFIIRKMFALTIEGYGTWSIAKILMEQGYRSRDGSIFRDSTIFRILKNPAYKGHEYANKWKSDGDGKVGPRVQSEWLRMPEGIRPAIVDEHTWERAQSQKKKNYGDAVRNEYNHMLLRGILFCGLCDKKMYPVSRGSEKRNQWRYRCATHQSPTYRCKGMSPGATKLHRRVWNEVATKLKTPDALIKGIQSYYEGNESNSLPEDIKTVENQLSKVEKGLQRLVAAFRNADDILAPHLEREMYVATQEKETLQKTLTALKDKSIQEKALSFNIEHFTDIVQKFAPIADSLTPTEQREVLLTLGVKVILTKEKCEIIINPLK